MPKRTKRGELPKRGDPGHWATPQPEAEQLKMFMTPREIVSKYQVLDADRQEYGQNEWDFDDEEARNYQRTGRSQRTGGQPNAFDPGNIHYAEGGSGNYIRQPREESDEEVLSRKAKEASYDPDYYGEMRGHALTGAPKDFDVEDVMARSSAPQVSQRSGGSSVWDSFDVKMDSYVNRKRDEHYRDDTEPESLFDSIARGGVEQPVHLGAQFGSQGKPQIVGGHHRIAAALESRPDDLIPVLHHEDIYEAKESRGYKYR